MSILSPLIQSRVKKDYEAEQSQSVACCLFRLPTRAENLVFAHYVCFESSTRHEIQTDLALGELRVCRSTRLADDMLEDVVSKDDFNLFRL